MPPGRRVGDEGTERNVFIKSSVILRNGIHDAKHRTSVHILNGKVDAMGLLINRYAVRLICQVALGNLVQGRARAHEGAGP